MSGWQSRAGCHGEDPELFFPAGRDDSLLVAAHLRKVRPICAACPVAPDCLRWAIDTAQEHGLWAATTPSERRRARRQAREQRRHALQNAEPAPAEPVAAEPVAPEPVASEPVPDALGHAARAGGVPVPALATGGAR